MYHDLVKELARILVTDIAPIELGYTAGITRSGDGWQFTLTGTPDSVILTAVIQALPPAPAAAPAASAAPAAPAAAG